MCPFDVIFSANDSVFRAEHDPLLRTAYFLSKTQVLRVRKRCSTLKVEARYIVWAFLAYIVSAFLNCVLLHFVRRRTRVG